MRDPNGVVGMVVSVHHLLSSVSGFGRISQDYLKAKEIYESRFYGLDHSLAEVNERMLETTYGCIHAVSK